MADDEADGETAAQADDAPTERAPGAAKGRSAADPVTRIAALERELARVSRMQQHQRLQTLSLHGALNRMHESLKGQVDLDYPEALKAVSYLDNSRDDILFMAFAGLNLGVGIPAFEFRRTMSEHQAPGYFIKDFHQSWYQQGLLGLADDLEGARDYLGRLAAGHGPRDLVTLGASTGGYAAILFGCWLGASRVLAFSPQTNITRRVAARFAQLDTPPEFLRNPAGLPDLAEVVREAPHRPKITIYFGAGHRHDVQQAKRLQGLANVSLIPIEGTDNHSMPAELRRRGELDAVLADFLKPAG